MPDDYPASSRLAAPPRRSFRTILGTALLAFLLGAGAIAWLVFDGRLNLSLGEEPQTVAALPAPAAQTVQVAPPSAAQIAAPTLDRAAAGLDQRLAGLEQRLTQLDLQAQAAAGNVARAEGLLVAFAARRAIERGAPLGYLEDQLKLRFADAQPAAVSTVIDAARQPVTLARLDSDLADLGDRLTAAPVNESAWDKVTRELSGLFVIRHDAAPSALPGERIERARLLLRTGQIDAAVAEVERLPGAAAGAQWMIAARRHASAQRALDLIEMTATIEPRRLDDGQGAAVTQASPLDQPAPALPSPPAVTK